MNRSCKAAKSHGHAPTKNPTLFRVLITRNSIEKIHIYISHIGIRWAAEPRNHAPRRKPLSKVRNWSGVLSTPAVRASSSLGLIHSLNLGDLTIRINFETLQSRHDASQPARLSDGNKLIKYAQTCSDCGIGIIGLPGGRVSILVLRRCQESRLRTLFVSNFQI